MYLMRMEEALETDYPVLASYLVTGGFFELVQKCVCVNPSTSYTLNRLGDHVPQFFLDHPDRPDAAFLHDLARLELALTEVYDEQESPVLSTEDLQSVPPEAWEDARLRPISAFRLLAFRHSVIPHLVAFHEDKPGPTPRRRASWVAIYRRDYSVLRLALSRAEHDLLRALTNGAPLGEALSAAAAKQKSARKQAKIFSWFRTWIAEGLFESIE